MKEAGVRGVIAPSFARIFFRNAINIGLPLAEADLPCRDGEQVVIDLSSGRVSSDGKERPVAPLSARMLDILSSGGLVEFWRKKK